MAKKTDKHEEKCPNCGRCPTCGHVPQSVMTRPWPWYPPYIYPTLPAIEPYWGTVTISSGGDSSNQTARDVAVGAGIGYV